MISSVAGIISELNKAVLQRKKFQELTKLEKLKIEARRDLAEFKAKAHASRLLAGKTINIQNNNQLVTYNQDEMLTKLIEVEAEYDKTIDLDNSEIIE
jgi:hypothetical protein